MKHLKTLGLAAATALALIAFLGASSASANWFKTEVEETTWNGSLVGSKHVLNLGGETFSCSKVSFSGNTYVTSTGQLTVNPELKGCGWFGFYEAGWSMNGCKLRFHPGAPGAKLVGSADIVGCEKAMTFTATGCSIFIGNQNGIGTVEYKNSIESGKEVITAVANLEGITYSRPEAGAGGCASGGPGTFHNGTYTGEWKIKGSSGGFPASVKVESAALPSPTIFATEEAPATVTATSGASGRFLNFPKEGAAPCKSTGSTELTTVGAGSLTISPALSGCEFKGTSIGVTDSMGGCSFKYSVNGTYEIVGATCASNPITVAETLEGMECTVTVGPQGPLSGLNFTNEGLGRSRVVKMVTTGVVGIKYTSVGKGCWEPGTYSDGESRSTLTIKAANSKGESQGISVE